jgi:hypothetical protein
MRELTDLEFDYVCGGYDDGEDIIVTGYPDPGMPWFPYSPYYPSNPSPPYGGGSSGPAPAPTHTSQAAMTDNTVSPCAGSAALRAASDIATLNASGQEYSATLVQSGTGVAMYKGGINTFASSSDNYNDSNVPFVLPSAASGVHVVGELHNHDINGVDSHASEFPGFTTQQVEMMNRYPSINDWADLQTIYNTYSSANPGYNPSLYIVDPFGVTREYKYSDMSQYVNLATNTYVTSLAQLAAGVNLPAQTVGCAGGGGGANGGNAGSGAGGPGSHR